MIDDDFKAREIRIKRGLRCLLGITVLSAFICVGYLALVFTSECDVDDEQATGNKEH